MLRARVARRWSRPAAALAAVGLLWSCTGDDTGIRRLPFEPTASPGVLAISPNSVSLAWIGAQATLSAKISTADGGSVQGFTYTWGSLNPSVATVNQQGTVTAVAEGTAKVVATVLNLADTVEVTVKRLPATIILAPDTVLFTELGATATIGISILDGGGQALGTPATWTSSDTSVVTVSSAGVVTATGQGQATVTARAGSASKTASMRVSVGPSSIGATPTQVNLAALGDTARITATVRDARGDVLEGIAVAFSGGDSLVATVDSTGLVTAVGNGNTNITVTGDTVVTLVRVDVAQVADSISVSPKSATLLQGATQTFSAAVFDANRAAIASPTLTWASGDTAVFTVSGSGVVTAVAGGSASLSVTSGSVADTAAITVIAAGVDSVDVTPDTVTLAPGASTTLSAKFFTGGVEVLGPTAVWTSSADSIATVDTSGKVTALSSGTAWIKATVDSLFADSTRVTVSAPASNYNVVVRYVGTLPSVSQRAAFAAAEARWEEIIVGNLQAIAVTLTAGQCGIDHPALNEAVDDVVIYAEVVEIDGVGGVLGQAGPCLVRNVGGLPVVGTMQFDAADMNDLEATGLLQATILHEMGHAIGFGVATPWTNVLVNAGGSDPYWPGAQAVARYDEAGGTAVNKVPVEETGGEGTRDAHWRESDMGAELMTGYLNAGTNPLSAITLGAMLDMGYVVNYDRADSYTVSAALRSALRRPPIALRDVVLQPIGSVDASGRVTPFRPR